MPFVTSREMILKAQKEKYGVGAFNVENMEMAQAVIMAAEELHSPVILQTTSGTLKYGTVDLFYGIVSALANAAKIPVALHLDHGNGFDISMNAIRAGYTSIMIDGSHEAFEDNIAVTKRVADVCNACKIPVEAELGMVGGKEDDRVSIGPGYTNPDEAEEFVKRTGIFSLAIGIGTSHGVYKGTPVLDMERISAIAKKIRNPLVLHGTSGVPDDDVKECIERGMCKINYATELRFAFSDGVKEYIAKKPEVFDPKEYLKAGRERVFELVRLRLIVCGSTNKAF